MSDKQISIIKQQLTIKGDRPVISSVLVAEAFGKQHNHVLRDIDELDCSEQYRLSNFGQTVIDRPNPSGGMPIASRAFDMTRDGFVFLVMGYTGERAAQLKEAYISAFNAMERELLSGLATTRDSATNELLAVVAEAAGKGYPANFIPELVRCRRSGLSCSQTARVLGVSSSAVSNWHRKLNGAGVRLPKGGNISSTVAFFRGKQALLPGIGGQA